MSDEQGELSGERLPAVGSVYLCKACGFAVMVIKDCCCTDCECVGLACCGQAMECVTCVTPTPSP